MLRLFLTLLFHSGIWDGSKGGVGALIMRHCVSFQEDLFRDIAYPVPPYIPGLGLYAECSNVTDFRSDLLEVSPEVRSLRLTHSASTLPSNSFSQFKALEVLRIDGKLEKIQSGAFLGLAHLKYLHLKFSDDFCRDVILDSGVFQGLCSLEELMMLGLNFSEVPNSLFSPLVKLSKLELRSNCVEDISKVFCRLPLGLSHLETLDLSDNYIGKIQNGGCEGSGSWPTPVLSGIKNLDLTGNPIEIIVPESLKIFQNLTSLGLYFKGQWLGSIWESGIGSVKEIFLAGGLALEQTLKLNFQDTCSLVSKLEIQSLTIKNFVIDDISVQMIQKCRDELRELSMWHGEVKSLDFGFWVSASGIKVLEMVEMKLKNASFCTAGKGKLWNIRTLNLPRNSLTAIEGNQFVCMPLLEQLDLEANAIECLESDAFHGLRKLKTLSLAGNKIKKLVKSDFASLVALEVLQLLDNTIESIEEGVFSKQEGLQELTLGKLQYIYELYLQMLFYGFPSKLHRLKIDAGIGVYLNVGNIPPRGTPFDLELIGEKVMLFECESPLYQDVRELKVTGQFTCGKLYMVPFFENLESFECDANPEMSIKYTGISRHHRLKRLMLSNLVFNDRTDPSLTFRNLSNLEILVLLNCRLSYLTESMFHDLRSLRLLRLYSDNPLIILEGAFYPLVSLSVLSFERLDFSCKCGNVWLLEWMEGMRSLQVVNIQKQICVMHYRRLNFLSTMEWLCQTQAHYLCWLSTAVLVLLFLSSALGYRFARWPCLVLFFRVSGWVERKLGKKRRKRRGIEEEEEEERMFDAFVSYSSKDEAWVTEEMVRKLEREGETRLRLCLHNRDFEVGKGIVDNIADSVYGSRCTVCVLSRRYLRSDWCTLEMRVATHRLLADNTHRLILIFLEHISPFELSPYHRLAKLAKTRTYLDWPEEEGKRVEFWERLRRNIADREGEQERWGGGQAEL
ncbi:toll-like receptor 13 [Anguilla anguilla]|uniref:toll-like receptor 13 n=1 Tax=Anguilla anguilla TaxID=7936 RepID=UPI0015ADA3CB|nr:toll-like receptor 13 [Anguilla anguilla]